MSVVELHADDGAELPASACAAVVEAGPQERDRPNVSGDLTSLFRAAPMFRRAVAGYDRFQVDTYVEWAEDELATSDREREHLLARHLSTRAALDEARRLLAHSAGGGEFLQLSRRMGSMLAVAADEAESLRSDAEADRCAARLEAERMATEAERVLAHAEAAAERAVLEATVEIDAMTAEADRLVKQAERTGSDARAEAEARLEKVRLMEQLAIDEAEQIRRQAVAEASAARLQARYDVVGMLSTAREARRRADDEAAATRALLERDAAARCASLRAEVATLEHRRSVLRAEVEIEVDVAAEPVARPSRPLDARLRELLERLRWRSGSLRAP